MSDHCRAAVFEEEQEEVLIQGNFILFYFLKTYFLIISLIQSAPIHFYILHIFFLGIDHQLLIGCKHEIKSHCPEQNEVNGLLNCLKEAKNDANFDRGCKMIVNRRIIQHTRDYRLRPRLQRACEKELSKFCGEVLLHQGKNNVNNVMGLKTGFIFSEI